jgi:hypothetical protein
MLDAEPATPVVAYRAQCDIDDVLDAVRAYLDAEGTLWRIGDLLLELCGPPGADGAHNGSNLLMAKIARRLKDTFGDRAQMFGLDYLRRLRSVAHAFPPGTRVPGAPCS